MSNEPFGNHRGVELARKLLPEVGRLAGPDWANDPAWVLFTREPPNAAADWSLALTCECKDKDHFWVGPTVKGNIHLTGPNVAMVGDMPAPREVVLTADLPFTSDTYVGGSPGSFEELRDARQEFLSWAGQLENPDDDDARTLYEHHLWWVDVGYPEWVLQSKLLRADGKPHEWEPDSNEVRWKYLFRCPTCHNQVTGNPVLFEATARRLAEHREIVKFSLMHEAMKAMSRLHRERQTRMPHKP